MKNRILIAFCAIFMTFHASSQIAVYKAKQLVAIDSIKLVNDWIKSISKDSAFVGVTDKDIPSALAVKKHLSGSLLGYVPIARTINGYPLSTNISLNKADVGLGNVDNTSDANKPVSSAQAASIATKQATLVSGTNIKTVNSNSLLGSGDISVSSLIGYTPENAANKNANNGYAGLDAGGKVPFSLLPAALMIYKGTWNASTNSPSLSDGTGTSGWVYIVSTGGTVNTGSGSITYVAGDYAIHNGSIWQRSVGTNNVSSVNGQQGVVTLTTSNISEGSNLYYTDARVSANSNVAANTAARHNAVTIGTANGLSLSTQALSLAAASTSTTGALTSTDWNTFNGKENALTFSTGLSRVGNTITNTITQYTDALARASFSFSAGSGGYNSTTGVITIPTNNNQITNGAGYITGNQTITLSGDISGSGTTAITTTIGAGKVTNAMLAGSIDYAKMNAATVPTWNQNTTGTAANVTGTVAVANGGTGATTAAAARANLGLAIGTDVLAFRTFGTAANNNSGDFVAFRTFGSAANNNSSDFYASGSTVANSTLWNGLSFVDAPLSSPLYFTTSTGSGVWQYSGISTVQTALGLGSAAYTASSAYYAAGSTVANSTLWNGVAINLGSASTAPDYVATFQGGILRYSSFAQLQTSLNLGSYAYRSSGLAELSGAMFTGQIQPSYQNTINTTTPGTQTYGLHFVGQTTADYANGITWNGASSGAQAGIYVQGSGSYGTKMYLATTDNFTTGAKTALSIDQSGNIVVTRGAFTANAGTFTTLAVSSTSNNLGNINTTNSTGGYITWQTNGTTIADIGTATQVFGSGGSEVFAINGRGARDIAFGTNNIERFRIYSSGAASFYSTITTGLGGVIISSTNTKVESDGSSLYLKAAGNTYLNTAASAYVDNGGMLYASATQIPNGGYYKAIRNTGSASINLLGIESGTDNTVMVASNMFKLRNTGIGDAANLFTVSTSGNGVFTGSVTAPNAYISNSITAYSVGLNGSAGGWARHYSFIGSTGTNRGGFGAFGSDNSLSYYYIGNAYSDNKVQIDASTGAVTASSLAGSGDRMVVANSSGVLSTQAIPSAGTSGTYTPTLTYENGDLSGAGVTTALYTRAGNIVTVTGAIYGVAASPSSGTGIRSFAYSITLPITQTNTNKRGTGVMQGNVTSGIGSDGGRCFQINNNSMYLDMIAMYSFAGNNLAWNYTFSYEVN